MSRRQLVVHVINRLAPGGSEKQLMEVGRRSRLDHEIVELRGSGASALRELAATLRAFDDAPIVAWLDRPQLAVALTMAFTRRPLVASVRGLPRRSGPRRRWPMKAALARYDHLVANSRAVSEATLRFVRPLRLGRCTVIPNGVEISPTAPAIDRLSRSDGRFRVGFIGRASPWKGLDVLLEALKSLSSHGVTATLIGDGVPEALGSACHDGLAASGSGRTDDPWNVLGDVDLLVVPSRSEGSPNVVIEAFARGVPVLGTEVGGTVELLQDGRGWLVPPRDPVALAESILRAARDEAERAKRAATAKRYVEKVHGWPAVVEAWDALLEPLVYGRDG
jgi:glycosyltransferase involved in cell wall biosynthesis